MAFHDVRLPEFVQYGSQFGSGFNTFAQETASGHEFRIARQAQPRHRLSLKKQMQSAAEAAELKQFAIGRRGMLHSFRAKDWSDYNSSETGSGTVTELDQVLGSYAGASAAFPLIKTYDVTGDDPFARRIALPVTGTVRVAIGGSELTLGVDFTLTNPGGVVTINAGLSSGVVTSGFQFDVQARFARSIDQLAALRADDFDNWTMSDLDLIEVLDEIEYPERWYPGGVTNWGSVAADITLSMAGGSLQRVTPTASINAYLPAPPLLFPGGDKVFTVRNDAPATHTVQLRDDAGNVVGSAIGPSSARQLLCSVSGGSFSWVIL